MDLTRGDLHKGSKHAQGVIRRVISQDSNQGSLDPLLESYTQYVKKILDIGEDRRS
jgi:hypothetical protein